MDYTENLNLAKPSRNADDIADIDVISENFQKIDDKVEVNSNKVQKLQPNDTSKDNYPSTYAVISYAVPFSNVLREKTDSQKPNTALYNANVIDEIVANINERLSAIGENPPSSAVQTWFKAKANVQPTATIEETEE